MDEGHAYQDLRPLLFSIAYRMVGSVGEAEDIVQEAFLRFHRTGSEQVASPRAYLSTVTTRLAIDHLRSARVRRERYMGEWLPEPLVTAEDDSADPARHAETADSLSMAFLVLLERLSPVERAVFLLREVFGYDYEEIAGVIDRREDNARQIAARARRHVQAGRTRFEASRQQRDELAKRFLAAFEEGDTEGLVGMLAEDVVMYGDGGGNAPALSQPVHGAVRVARLLAGLARQASQAHLHVRPVAVNGQPGAIVTDPEDRVVGVVSLDIVDGLVQTVRSVVNPDKLRHLGPVTDWSQVLRPREPGG
jgi:RNA polymerase sigma-70 factor (ECF subfamily)